jgi:hypothetical protein
LNSQNNFRGSVITTLNIVKSCGEVLAAGSKVDNFDLGVSLIGEEDIFRLQIAVDDVHILHVLETFAYLFRNVFQLFGLEGTLPSLSVHFLVPVQVI